MIYDLLLFVSIMTLFFFFSNMLFPQRCFITYKSVLVGSDSAASEGQVAVIRHTHTHSLYINLNAWRTEQVLLLLGFFFFILFMYSGWLTATSTGLKHRYLTHQQKTRALLPASMHLSRVFRLPICNIWFPFLLFFVFRPGLISLNMASQGETAKP